MESKIHYLDTGSSNRTFILLHGFGASIFNWREIVHPLSMYGRVIALGRPVFGLTERWIPPGLPTTPTLWTARLGLSLGLWMR